ncbi:MAG: glucose-6-phosphate isomerase [Acidobacteria bacterium]|nr:glucose-6-phosphate isomerase [Acidobacteriota bacterium]
MDWAKRWQRYRDLLFDDEALGLRLDLSRMGLPEGFLGDHEDAMARAFAAMAALEAGAIANPDENRRVGHYWLRAPGLAPEPALAASIRDTVDAVRRFAQGVHAGTVRPPRAERFTDLLVIGIGGSALGPQLLADALGDPRRDALAVHFFDNTDPDGMTRTLDTLGARLERTLCIVISKSGGTPETRNGMLVAREALAEHGLDFAAQAVAITGEGSTLDRLAEGEGWLERFPMWSWVGGRTSVTSAVGLLPAALQGLDIEALLRGAAACDARTRIARTQDNPAALLALAWFHATGGVGRRDMVVLPYKDRLLLFSRYLQQLVMESLGKGRDLDGRPVEQGIAVYGNKGSTDQHAYVQQLREGVDNFFVTFIEVLEHGGVDLEVEAGITCGDYLRGFLLGTREALAEGGRPSMTLSLRRLDAHSLGALIALYERAVGLYATLVHVNAYHQPGVEAGKKAAAGILDLQRELFAALAKGSGRRDAGALAAAIGRPEAVETVFQLLEAAAANGRIRRHRADDLFATTYEAL